MKNIKSLSIFVLIGLGLGLAGAAHAAPLDGFSQEYRSVGQEDASPLAQILLPTPSPQSIDPEDLVRPVESEAGRDLSLVVVAIVLVAIVVFGVIWGIRLGSPPHSKDHRGD